MESKFLSSRLKKRYRNIVDRLVGMRLVYDSPLMVRNVSFAFMNQELVWNGFAELVLFLFPLINFDKIRRTLLKIFLPKSQIDTELLLPNEACGICKTNPAQVCNFLLLIIRHHAFHIKANVNIYFVIIVQSLQF